MKPSWPRARRAARPTSRSPAVAAAATALSAVLLLPAAAAAQADPFNFRFTSGQSVAPIFDGWSRNPDGTFEMHFGYINRNHVEELHVPVGPDNRLESGPDDQGQPTFFYPRVHRQVFSVTVPADFGEQELVWSLTVRGARQQAVAWLDAVWEIDPVLRGRTPTAEQRANRPPTLTLDAAATVDLPAPLTVTARVQDDGLPPARGPRVRARGQETPPTLQPPEDEPRAPVNVPVLGSRSRPETVRLDDRLGITWTVLRGPASVVVEADPPAADGAAQALGMTLTFRKAGEYRLRARLSDGHLFDDQQLAVTVR